MSPVTRILPARAAPETGSHGQSGGCQPEEKAQSQCHGACAMASPGRNSKKKEKSRRLFALGTGYGIHDPWSKGALEELRQILGINYMPEIVLPSVSGEISRRLVQRIKVERPALVCGLHRSIGSGYRGKIDGSQAVGQS